jgi:hypothetical protein
MPRHTVEVRLPQINIDTQKMPLVSHQDKPSVPCIATKVAQLNDLDRWVAAGYDRQLAAEFLKVCARQWCSLLRPCYLMQVALLLSC